MTIQTIYKGYTYTLKSNPGYTSAVSSTSRKDAYITQPPAQHQPDDKNCPVKETALHEHTQDRSDWHDLGNFRYNLMHRFDPHLQTFAAIKLAEANKFANHQTGKSNFASDAVTIDSRNMSHDDRSVAVDSALTDDKMYMSSGEKLFHQDTVKETGKSGSSFSVSGEKGGGGSFDRYGGPISGKEQDTSYLGKNFVNTDFGSEKNKADVVTEKDRKNFVFNTLSPGIIDSQITNVEFGVNMDQKIGGPGVLPREKGPQIVKSLDDVLREPLDNKNTIAGTVVISQTFKDQDSSPRDVAKIAVNVGQMRFDTGTIIPERDIVQMNAYPQRPDQTARRRALLEAIQQRAAFTATTAIKSPKDPTADPTGRMMMSYETSPAIAGVESKEAYSVKTNPKPELLQNQFLYLQDTAPYQVEIEQKTVAESMSPQVVDVSKAAMNREKILVNTEERLIKPDVTTSQSYYSPQFPPEAIRETVTTDNPYDYRSHFERVVTAERVMDEARDYQELKHIDKKVNNVEKAVHNEKTKKIVDNEIYGRDDPRIQEVIQLKERVDVFALAKAVQVEGEGKNGLPTYNTFADATEYVTRAQLVDNIALDWSARNSQT